MSDKTDGNKNTKSAKVLKLGFNISVSGDPETDFEIFLDDKEQKSIEGASSKTEQFQYLDVERSTTNMPKQELEKTKTQEVTYGQSTGAIPKHRKAPKNSQSSESPQLSESDKTENSTSKDSNIIDQIRTTMEHFEKFSDHIKEIPRLRNNPVATSTPLSNKCNSMSDPNLIYPEYRPRKFSHRYDFYSRKEYFKSSVRPLPPDLFLKPLPAEGYYRRGIYTRCFDLEPYRYYGSDSSLNKSSDHKSICSKSNHDIEKYEECSFPSEQPSGILKKSDSESGDKQSTSSADSIKDIKIYQSGGILIMQNFKEGLDFAEKKEMSDFSAKLIENCNKLKMEVSSFQDDLPAIGNSSDENKNLGKTVQFDLSSFEGQKSKSGDSSSNAGRDESSTRVESSESTSDYLKNKDSSPQGTSQSQDFPSLSTQENDSIVSNQPGMSPSYASSKKLEWDSGADVGYLNLDLTKENLSTIEKIVLKGLSSDGRSEKNVVYEKQPEQNQTNRSKFILERMPSDLIIGGLAEGASNSKSNFDGSKPESDSRKLSQDESAGNAISKGEIRPKFEETKPSNESSAKRISTTKPTETQPKRKSSETTDKSVNVNTLFDNVDFQSPLGQSSPKELIRSSESPAKPKSKKSPKVRASKSKSRLSKVSKKSVPPASRSSSSFGMGVPKKVYKKFEATPSLNDVELSREVEEIIIDQRFKIKQNLQTGQTTKEAEIPLKDKVDGLTEVKVKDRPISGSSATSKNTVLSRVENVEEKSKTVHKKLSDQTIQTSDYDCESVGVQAFSSQKSSDIDFRCFGKKCEKPSEKSKESVNTSSKNIQVFGLNSSLPKQLEHPKGTELIADRHAKSTQYFGGPINSLPNYHSNLITKPGETCGRMPNVLKTKKNSEAEIIRLKEENAKNILANDAPDTVPLSEPKTDTKSLSSNDNKENLITKKSTNSKRSQSSMRNLRGNGTPSQDSEVKVSDEKAKKRTPSVEGSDCPHTSDEVSSMILTSEVLKVHGDSIDRNIIKEKYFQSQLVEMEKRKMISRSTSMEMQLHLEGNETGKEYNTTGCQYSPQSRGTTSGGRDEEPEDESSKENSKRNPKKSSAVNDGSSQNIVERFGTVKSTQMGAGDSLPSSTQTAHSWVPGVQNSRENSSGVGRARSFEYLPGHIYESSGNLREELPSETEQNLITSSSESDTAKGSASDGGDRDSEGRKTLILENSSENSDNSNQGKVPDGNLSRLGSALLNFWEKDAQVQTITQSLFKNFWKKRGCGDWFPPAEANSSKTEMGENEHLHKNAEKHPTATLLGSGEEAPKKSKSREFSIACQTEGESPSPDSEKLYEGRKALERRIEDEKKNQIKWIEKEINHLNILRKLLEKQNSPVQRNKKQPNGSNETSKSEDPGNGQTNIFPKRVTPVYGCTVILDENPSHSRIEPDEMERESEEQFQNPFWVSRYRVPGSVEQYQYMNNFPHLSASRSQSNWANVNSSVAVQASMNSSVSPENRNWEEMNDFDPQTSTYGDAITTQPYQSDVNTQFPSAGRASRSVQLSPIRTDFDPGKCNTCHRENCFCLNFSENSYSSLAPSSKSRTSEKRITCENTCVDGRNKASSSTGFRTAERTQVFQRERSPGQNDRSETSPAKYNSHQSTKCKCLNCPKRLCSVLSKAGITCREKCQPNVYVNCERVSEECHCSKIQIQKSSNCPGHLIKIHGTKCCASERCKRRTCLRRTEDQSCQTESPYPEQPAEKPPPQELRTPFPEEKAKQETPPGEEDVNPKTKPLNCSCKRKAERERARAEEHPRHYFLRIEETEVEDSTESEQKKSLEVITVTVPVKKAGKSKIYGSSVTQQSSTDNSQTNTGPSSCNCCSECAGNHRKQPNYEPSGSPNIRRRAEKPESPPRNSSKHTQGSDVFYEEYTHPSREPSRQEYIHPTKEPSHQEYIHPAKEPSRQEYIHPAKEPSRQEYIHPAKEPSRQEYIHPAKEPSRQEYIHPAKEPSRQEYYRNRTNGSGLRAADSYGRGLNGSPEPECCEACNCINRTGGASREFQTEYNSHKKRRNVISKSCCDDANEGSSGYGRTNGRYRSDTEAGAYDRSESRHRGQDLDPEFYNYNKREFMTKSEILKEERQKRNVRQPTLQECLSSNRPDFYSSAESRRNIITKRAEDRIRRHKNRMECLMNIMQQCNEKPSEAGSKRIFTTVQMREQTMKRYRKLPEVAEKKADQKKKDEYRTNRLMAEVFAKKLQIEALKGHINLSNSVSVLYTV